MPNNNPKQAKKGKSNPKQTKKDNKEKWKEPKVKWKKSRAKQLLYDDILAARVPSEATHEDGTSTMQLKDIYLMHTEYTDYHYSKFSARVSSIRTTIKDRNIRKEEDEQLFAECIKNHPGSAFSHKGFIQWQGSEAQELAKEDIAENLHLTMGKKALHGFRPEHYENFPLKDFRDKICQEVRTAKWRHTLKIKGKQHKAS
jgi:hypothetical protein